MAGRRYSRIQQASRLAAESAAYIEWLSGKGNRQPNIGTKGAKPATTIVYIEPFNEALATTQLVKQSANSSALSTYEAALTGHVNLTLPAGDSALKLRGYRAPRVNIVTPGGAESTKTSHITGAKYVSKGNKSVSIPFGKSATTDTEISVFSSISGNAAFTGKKVYLIPEKI